MTTRNVFKLGYHDNQPAALQGSQIPILRSRSASLTRPGRHWSRSQHISPSPSHSQSSLSSPHPLHQESELSSSKNIPDSTFTDKRFSSHQKGSETIGSSEHSPVQVGRIDSSLRSHGNSSRASSRHAPSATHQVQASSTELSHSGFLSEEKEPVNRVASQVIRNADDYKTKHSQNPAPLSSVALRKSKKSTSVNQNGASSMSSTNIDRHHSLYLTQSKSLPHLKKKRSNSLGGHTRLQQPLKAVPGFLKSSVPDAIGTMSQRMAGTSGMEHEVDFREMYQVESQQHRMTVETYQQLQVGYLTLLKENAEIKNTVDSMRLGAEVKLITTAPPPVSVETGTLPPARHANIFTLSKMSTPSLSVIQREARVAEAGTVTTPQQATLSEISQGNVQFCHRCCV